MVLKGKEKKGHELPIRFNSTTGRNAIMRETLDGGVVELHDIARFQCVTE